ncbi:MAG TPA: ThuA domain-containing protein [Bryobacteraceae bacterium]|nr:ThuA domain-containing protein [Bryobacteraceae bacterium]
MKKLLLALSLAVACLGQQPKFKVLAFYSTTVEPDHVLFAHDALKLFPEIARENHFTFEATTDWNQLNETNLKRYQLILWLDDSPHTTAQQKAFEKYMANGGGWMGFHASGYNDKDSGWPWFAEFLGGVFYDNSWPPLPGILRVDARENPVTKNIPAKFLSPTNEWYGWKPNPRSNQDIRVLLTLDSSNYPLGLKDVLTDGDLPVVWTNTKYKMIYLNIGHGDKIFTSLVQNRLITNAVLWLGSKGASAKAWTANTPAAGGPPEGAQISPLAAAVNPKTGKAYVLDSHNGTVTLFGGTNGSSSSIKVGMEPVAIAVNSDSNKIYVSNKGSGTVSVIDGATNSVTATVHIGSLPYVLAVNPVSNKIYVSRTFSNTIAVIDGATNAVTPIKAIQADSIAVNPRTNKIYLLEWEDKTVTVIDGATNAVNKIPGGLHLWGSAANPVTNKLYVANAGSGIVTIIDGATGAASTVKTGSIPCAIALDTFRNKAYVVNYGSDSVTVIDGATHSALATIKVGAHPQAIAFDSKNNRVYVANTHGDSVSIIDGETNSLTATKAAGKNPFALAVDEAGGNIYAADMSGQAVTAFTAQ